MEKIVNIRAILKKVKIYNYFIVTESYFSGGLVEQRDIGNS